MAKKVTLFAGWVLLTTIGAFVGLFLAVEIIGVVLWRWFGIPGIPAPLAILTVMFAAGFAHGASIGVAESLVLRRLFHGIRSSAWTLVTAAGAGLAWALGTGANLLLANENWSGPEFAGAIVFGGLALGSVVGTSQWLLLRRELPHSGWWIPVNAVAWVAGMAIAFFAASAYERGAGDIVTIAILAGAGAGAAIGMITGIPLLTLLQTRRTEAVNP